MNDNGMIIICDCLRARSYAKFYKVTVSGTLVSDGKKPF